jgi:hypothetical protein
MIGKTYIVLEKDGLSGLTVGSHVVKNGKTFVAEQWNWGYDALIKAVKSGRCKEVSASAEAKAEPEKDNKKVG